ncbi:MAG: hypothetical protein IJ423_05070 [Clostridia bacterium]|nr:hypothetical protein [Clostridia bacterium]
MGAYYSEAQNKASQKYQKKAYDTYLLRLRKGQKEQIQAYAESNGESLNGYINRLIAEDMGDKLTGTKTEQEE